MIDWKNSLVTSRFTIDSENEVDVMRSNESYHTINKNNDMIFIFYGIIIIPIKVGKF